MNLENVQAGRAGQRIAGGRPLVWRAVCAARVFEHARMRASLLALLPPSLSGSDYARKKGSLPLSLVLCRKEVRCSGKDGRAVVMECEARD